MPFADVNGQHIYFEDSGGDGAAVIFSHGFLMDHDMFEPQVASLAGELIITWDRPPGFGRTTPATSDFTYWDSADGTLALLSHLGVERAFFVGMSQGGFISIRTALRAPDRVLGLGLIDTQAGLEVEGAPGLRRDDRRLGGERALRRRRHHRPTSSSAPVVMTRRGSPSGTIRRRTSDYHHHWSRDEHLDLLAKVTPPAIVFHGEADAAIPMEKASSSSPSSATAKSSCASRAPGTRRTSAMRPRSTVRSSLSCVGTTAEWNS